MIQKGGWRFSEPEFYWTSILFVQKFSFLWKHFFVTDCLDTQYFNSTFFSHFSLEEIFFNPILWTKHFSQLWFYSGLIYCFQNIVWPLWLYIIYFYIFWTPIIYWEVKASWFCCITIGCGTNSCPVFPHLLLVVLSDCFLVKTRRMETLVVMDVRKMMERKVIKTQSNKTLSDSSPLFSLRSSQIFL